MTTKPIEKVAVVILENSDGHILITKRPEKKIMAGLWEFPGGKYLKDETGRECAQREIHEELGITLHPQACLSLGCIKHDYDNFTLHLEIHYCNLWQGQFKACDGQEMQWVPTTNLKDYPMPAANQELLRLLPALLEHVHCQLEGV